VARAWGITLVGSIPVLRANVVRAYPHDPLAFTQGLEYYGGYLYESTGIAGQSTLRKVALKTGEVVQKVSLPRQYFGEGLTIFRGKIYQLTWMSKKGFVYDLHSFQKVGEFPYVTEGWGLTHDDASLIMSDGTSTLRFLELTRFTERRSLKVTDGGSPIANLNELEVIKGEIWANVWHTDYIARISPRDGRVVGWINLKGLSGPSALHPDAVLNGIAYDSTSDRVFVTGKLWPKLFEIKLK